MTVWGAKQQRIAFIAGWNVLNTYKGCINSDLALQTKSGSTRLACCFCVLRVCTAASKAACFCSKFSWILYIYIYIYSVIPSYAEMAEFNIEL